MPGELLTNPIKTLNIPNTITTTPNPANLSEITSYDTIPRFRQLAVTYMLKQLKPAHGPAQTNIPKTKKIRQLLPTIAQLARFTLN
jgi:hypothetical protein